MATRKKCSVCGVFVLMSGQVCDKTMCQYFTACERAAYWLDKSQQLKMQLNQGNVGMISDDGIAHTYVCKICGNACETGCGLGKLCSDACPDCVCNRKTCRSKIYSACKSSKGRRCPIQGCNVSIAPKTVKLLLKKSKTKIQDDCAKTLYAQACQQCEAKQYPHIYCKQHVSEHQRHIDEWNYWLDNNGKGILCNPTFTPVPSPAAQPRQLGTLPIYTPENIAMENYDEFVGDDMLNSIPIYNPIYNTPTSLPTPIPLPPPLHLYPNILQEEKSFDNEAWSQFGTFLDTLK